MGTLNVPYPDAYATEIADAFWKLCPPPEPAEGQPQITKAANVVRFLRQTIKATAHTYQGIPGLIRKYYGIRDDGKSLVGIYLWESKAAAERMTSAIPATSSRREPSASAMSRSLWPSRP